LRRTAAAASRAPAAAPAATRARRGRDGAADLRGPVGSEFPGERAAGLLLRDLDEPRQLPRRDVAPPAQEALEGLVRPGPVHELREAALREPGAGVAGDAAHHAPVAAMDQHVGDPLAQGRPPRDRQEVVLPAGPGDHHEVVLVEAARPLQDRPRDGGVEVEREAADDLARRPVEGAEGFGQVHPGPLLEVARQAQDHLVEDLDRALRERRLLVDEQPGEPAQGLDPARRVLARDRILDLHHERNQAGHGSPDDLRGDRSGA
jgi:hypothetical protein